MQENFYVIFLNSSTPIVLFNFTFRTFTQQFIFFLNCKVLIGQKLLIQEIYPISLLEKQ